MALPTAETARPVEGPARPGTAPAVIEAGGRVEDTPQLLAAQARELELHSGRHCGAGVENLGAQVHGTPEGSHRRLRVTPLRLRARQLQLGLQQLHPDHNWDELAVLLDSIDDDATASGAQQMSAHA